MALNLAKKGWVIVIAVCIGTAPKLSAQSNWQNWNGVVAKASLTEKLTARVGHMRAYSMSKGYQNIFNQNQIQLSYDLPKGWDLQSGVQFITPAASRETRTRIFVRASHTKKLDGNLSWTNALRVETNSANENRFRQRIIFSTRIGARRRLDFLNLSPSANLIFFYNIGGSPIRYYNSNKELIARQTPDGFHRARLNLNLNSKINEYLSVNLYYMRQQEFNFLSGETRKMNVYDPIRNRVLRPFNNFNALGLTLMVNLDPLFDND